MAYKPWLADGERTVIMQFLLANMKPDGKLVHGKMTEAAVRYNVSPKTVQRIWAKTKQQREEGNLVNVVKSRSRIRKLKHEIDYEKIQQIPKEKRGTIEAMSDALGIPKSTVGRWAKKLLRHHSNAIKPLLKAPNMLSRLEFCLQALHYESAANTLKFKAMENTIHIDEKWFMLKRKSCSYYLTPMEANPHRVCQSQKFIPKVMFMCAASRPVFAEDGTVLFDGKIGIWPFVEEVAAKRNSIRRPRGTIEIKPIQSITRKVIKDCIINEIIPAIKQKWPACLSKDISIQQDNARPHILSSDADFHQVANADGFKIKLVRQPANSPDCNVNDLGFFCAIQALQQRQNCKNADELIDAVKNSFNSLDPMTLNKVFLSLQCVLIEIMKCKGQNSFKQPHMNKNALLLQGTLPKDLEVPEYLVKECIDHLISEERTEGVQDLMEAMGINVPQMGEGCPDLNF